MKFLDALEEVLKSDERFVGENNQVIKTKVSDAARGSCVIIVTTADSNDEHWLSSPLLDKQNMDLATF